MIKSAKPAPVVMQGLAKERKANRARLDLFKGMRIFFYFSSEGNFAAASVSASLPTET